MEIKIRELVQKVGLFRLVLLVLAGVMLLVLSLPSGSSQPSEEKKGIESSGEGDTLFQAMELYAKRQGEETAKILSKVDGIGKVEVMLTLASSEEKITLQDDSVTKNDASQQDQAGGSRTDSEYQLKEESILVKQDGKESPYVVQVHSPKIEGVVVVAQGIDSSKREAEIIEAIQALFSIETHKIKVMKME